MTGEERIEQLERENAALRQIGDERSMPAGWGDDDRIAERERALAREETERTVKDGELAAPAARIAQVEAQVPARTTHRAPVGVTSELLELEASLDRLRQFCRRLDQRQLEPDDWALVKALILEEMT